MGVVGRLDQYASMLAWEFDEYSMSENLVTYSEQFDNAAWAKNNYNVTANATTAPDGTLTADKLIAINASTFHDLYKSPSLGSNTYTLSIFAKAAEQSFIQLRIDDSVLSRVAMFNLATGSVSSSSNVTSPTITSYPNGWYRCSITVTTNIINVVFNGFPTSSNATYSGDGVSGVFIWGAQFEYGSTATDYTPTTTTTISRILPATTNTNITGLGTYYSSGFDENVGFTTFLSANVFPPYDPVYDEFSGTSFGAGQGRYMRQNGDKSVIVYNEIDEITDFRDIVRSGLVLDLDAGMNSSYSGSGEIWTDLSGNSNNATRTNNGGYGGQATYNSSGYFDFSMNSPAVTAGAGAGNGFTMSSMIIPSTGNFTLSAFVRRNTSVKASGDRETIFSNTGNADGWRFGLGGGGYIYYLIGGVGGSGYQEGSLGGSTLDNGNWHMMTAVFDRAGVFGSYTIYGYVDGVSSGSATIGAGAGGNVAFSTQNPGVGYGGCCDVFAGQIATVSAYNRALTASEVAQNYNALKHRYGL